MRKTINCYDITGKRYVFPVNKLKFRPSVYGILIEKDKVLLSKQWDGYDFPGGGIKIDEKVNQALIREFKEETGIDIQVKKFLILHEFIDLPLHAIELFFEVSANNDQLITLGSDPELNPENQIIQAIDFLSLEQIKLEKPSNLHQLSEKFFYL